jgi:hypothetical protein
MAAGSSQCTATSSARVPEGEEQEQEQEESWGQEWGGVGREVSKKGSEWGWIERERVGVV